MENNCASNEHLDLNEVTYLSYVPHPGINDGHLVCHNCRMIITDADPKFLELLADVVQKEEECQEHSA